VLKQAVYAGELAFTVCQVKRYLGTGKLTSGKMDLQDVHLELVGRRASPHSRTSSPLIRAWH
jgi:hypothetical protein